MEDVRHGDVVLLACEKVDDEYMRDEQKEAKQVNRIVLQEGNVTGHSHVITTPKDSLKIQASYGGQRFLTVYEKAILDHEEHGKLEILPGIYKVMIERNHDPLSGMVNADMD